jgi:hypothetical protein
MPPRSSKGKAPVVPVTKGKKNTVPESDDEEHDVRVQEELLIRSAANVGKGTSSDRHLDPDVSYDTDILVPDKATPESFSFTERSSKKAPAETPKKKKKRSFHDLQGFGDLKDSSSNKSFDKKKDKDAYAHIVAAVHQQGPKTGQPSGNMYFAIHIPFGENEPFKAIVNKVAHVARPNFFEEQKEWAVKVPTKEVALRLFEGIKTSPKMRKTSSQLNPELDVSPFDKVKKPHFTLATSATQFETRNDGILPRSIMIVGNAFDFKEFLKAKFGEEIIKFQTLILDGGATIRSAWVLPCSAQTRETGTLAKYLKSLGVQITEVDLDVESDEDEEDEAGHPLVDDEAEEAVDEDEDDDL